MSRKDALKLFCLLTLCFLACACQNRAEEKTPPARTVSAPTLVLTLQKAVESRCFPGSVEPRNSITLASKVSGTVIEAGANEGDEVQKGDVVLRIDDSELRQRGLGLSSTEDQASLEEQSLAAQVAQARLDRDRMAKLAAQGAVSQDDYDKARNRYTSLARSMDALRAKSRSAAHQREELSALQSYARVTAPAHGILVRRFVDQGAFVTAGQPLASLDDLSGGYEFVVQVDESLLPRMAVGGKALLAVPGLSEEPLASTVSAVVRHVDPATRTFRVKLALPGGGGNATAAPRAGMFGRALFPVREVEKLLVPERLITRRGELPCLFAVDETGLIHFRVIKTGAAYQGLTLSGVTYLAGGMAGGLSGEAGLAGPGGAVPETLVEILAGVAPGERIVTGGTQTLREGDRLAKP